MAQKSDSPRARSKTKPQGEDADFLTEEFDIPEKDAVDLVARDGASPEDVTREARAAKRRRPEPLEDAPVPEDTDDFTADTDEDQLKPIVRTRNKRSGGG